MFATRRRWWGVKRLPIIIINVRPNLRIPAISHRLRGNPVTMVTVVTEVKINQVLLHWFGSRLPAFRGFVTGGVVPVAIGCGQLRIAPISPVWLVVMVMWLRPLFTPIRPVYVSRSGVNTLRLITDKQQVTVSSSLKMNIIKFAHTVTPAVSELTHTHTHTHTIWSYVLVCVVSVCINQLHYRIVVNLAHVCSSFMSVLKGFVMFHCLYTGY